LQNDYQLLNLVQTVYLHWSWRFFFWFLLASDHSD